MDPTTKRFLRIFLPAMALFLLLAAASEWLIQLTPAGPGRWLVALLPGLPLLAALAAFLRFLNELDELQRLIQLQAIGFAAGATAVVSLMVGFLEDAGASRPSWSWVTPLMILFWAVGLWIAHRRYR